MEDSKVLKIAVICSLAGLIALYFVSASIKPESLNPTLDFTKNNFISLNGTIKSISGSNGVYRIKVNYNSDADVVAFSKESLNFEEGDKIQVIGKTDSYDGKNQIAADKIKVSK